MSARSSLVQTKTPDHAWCYFWWFSGGVGKNMFFPMLVHGRAYCMSSSHSHSPTDATAGSCWGCGTPGDRARQTRFSKVFGHHKSKVPGTWAEFEAVNTNFSKPIFSFIYKTYESGWLVRFEVWEFSPDLETNKFLGSNCWPGSFWKLHPSIQNGSNMCANDSQRNLWYH